MKLKLPNGEKITLQTDISLEEKIIKVEELTNDWIEEIFNNWTSFSIISFLDGLSNYLIWHKEEQDKNKWDKEILGKTRTSMLNVYHKKSKVTNFSDLSNRKKELLLGEEFYHE